MAYANTNTNQALRDVRQMVAQMPEQRSQREYRSALGRGAELQAMAGLKESEMRLPALQLQKEQAQTELDQMNAPFRIQNLARGVGEEGPAGPYDVKVFPDQAAMLVQDQKYGPPAMTQFQQNVQGMGYQQAPDGTFLTKEGQPVAYKDAAPIHREWLRTMFLNTDMEKHRDNQVAFLKSKGNLTPEETQKLQKLESLSPLQLAEMRLQKLQEIQLEDPMWNRPEGKLLQPMLQQAQARYDELRGIATKQSDRDFEIKKLNIQESGKDRRANKYGRVSTAQTKLENEQALQHLTGQAAAMGIPLEFDESGNITSELDPKQMDMLNAMAGELGMTVYASPTTVEDTGSGWNPFDNKQVPMFQVHSIVPSANTAKQSQPSAVKGGPKVGPDGSIYTDSLPTEPDANGIIEINGQRYKVETVGTPQQPKAEETQAATPAKPTQQPAQQQQPPVQRAQPGAPSQTLEQWMAENPELAREPGIMSLINTNLSDEEKLKRIDRKIQQMRKSFVRKPPMVVR